MFSILSKCLLSSFVHFEERLAFSGKYVLLSCAMCFKSVWHSMGIVFGRRVHVSAGSRRLLEMPFLIMRVHLWGQSSILRQIPFVVLRACLGNVWHFAGNAFYRRV